MEIDRNNPEYIVRSEELRGRHKLADQRLTDLHNNVISAGNDQLTQYYAETVRVTDMVTSVREAMLWVTSMEEAGISTEKVLEIWDIRDRRYREAKEQP